MGHQSHEESKMKGHKGCILLFLMLILGTLGWLMLRIQKQQQEVRTQLAYYTVVLAQAPCIEEVCPGFNEGRTHALERLTHSELVLGKIQGTHLIGLVFIDSEGEIVGSGGIDFSIDTQDTPIIVQDIAFSLNNLKLESVFNTFGEPDQFLFISGCGMGRRIYAELFYLEQGIKVRVDYITRRPGAQVLAENTPVDAIVYLEPDDFQNQIIGSLQGFVGPYNVAYDFHPSVTADDMLAQMRPWPGIEASPTPTADFCPR